MEGLHITTFHKYFYLTILHSRLLYTTPASIDRAHDIIMDSWADNNDFMRYLVTPNLVQHVGMVSTVRQWAKKAAYFIY